jgi:hypothetical protein
MVALACWGLWKKRNRRVFNNAMAHAAQLSSWIMEEGRWWVATGYRSVAQFMHQTPCVCVVLAKLV